MDVARLSARTGLLAWLVLAGIFYGLTFRFDDAPAAFAWGPAAWPRGVLLLMVVAAIANYVANRPSGPRAGSPEHRPASGAASAEVLNVIGMVASPVVYLWLIPRAGFYASTLVFLPAYMMQLGERRWPILVGVSAALFVIFNLVFTRLFYVALPTGSWPFFYDVSNWFVTFVRM